MGQRNTKPRQGIVAHYTVPQIIKNIYGKTEAQDLKDVLRKFKVKGAAGLDPDVWSEIKRDRQGEVLEKQWMRQVQCLIKVSNRAKEEGWKYNPDCDGWDMKDRRTKNVEAPSSAIPPPYTDVERKPHKIYPVLEGRGWVCQDCGAQNPEWAVECVHCGAQKPHPETVAPVRTDTRIVQVNNPEFGQAAHPNAPPTVTRRMQIRTWAPWSADTLMALIQSAPDPVAKPAAFCRFVTQLMNTHEATWQDGED